MTRRLKGTLAKGTLVSAVLLAAVLLSRSETNANRASTPHASPSAPALRFAAGKICSGAVGGRFSDTVNVPDSYRIADCEALAKNLVGVARHTKGFAYNLGCLTEHGYVWGEAPGQPPHSNSCRWGE